MQRVLIDNIKSKLRTTSGLTCNPEGYVSVLADNLLPGVQLNHFEKDLCKGGGHELKKKFLAIHSSAALAINSFAPFKKYHRFLSILGKKGFDHLVFEKRLPTGLKGTPPNLDVYLQSDEEVMAIESKFLEYFSPKTARFSTSYVQNSLPHSEQCWWKVLEEAKTASPRHLDVAQLVKHYLGLIRLMNEGEENGWKKPKSVMLIYLYWEPVNWQQVDICRRHREELIDLSSKVDNSKIQFASLSYPELWREWQGVPEAAQHVSNLINRYSVEVQV